MRKETTKLKKKHATHDYNKIKRVTFSGIDTVINSNDNKRDITDERRNNKIYQDVPEYNQNVKGQCENVVKKKVAEILVQSFAVIKKKSFTLMHEKYKDVNHANTLSEVVTS